MLLAAVSVAVATTRIVTDVPARDGTPMHTIVLTPDGPGPFPTVVTRVPYSMDQVLGLQCQIMVRHGYACAWQHVRGRGRSGGEWDPLVNEERDGQDLVAWIRGQSWCDGKLAWLGDSYLAATGWAVALEDPDGLSTLVSRVFAPGLYTAAYEDGLLRHELITAWMTIMPDRRNRYAVHGDYVRALGHRPRLTLDEVAVGHAVPWYRQWLEAEDPAGPTWQREDARRFETAPEHTTIPVLMVGGWQDAFIAAQLSAWPRLASKAESLFVIGPWAHLGETFSAVPLRDPEARGSLLAALQIPRVIEWLDVHLRGATPTRPTHGVLTYVVGGDRWERREDWPPPTRERRFVASAGDGRCDGRLAEGGPGLIASLRYVYDPLHPLPSHGGDGGLAGAIPSWGRASAGFTRSPDRCPSRSDVLRFRSAPLPANLHFAGALRVEMEVSTDVEDTAFGFRLLEDRADGPTVLLREGFATLALRDGAPRRPYTPGTRVTVVPDATGLEAEIHAGSSLVLVLTSSSFPSYEAHPNVAGLLAAADTTRIAHQEVWQATLVVPEVEESQ